MGSPTAPFAEESGRCCTPRLEPLQLLVSNPHPLSTLSRMSAAESEAPQEGAAPAAGSPSSFLTAVVGEHVQVRLNSGVDYRGKLEILELLFPHLT